jgi:hypothetical protein
VLPIVTALAEYRQSMLAKGQLAPLRLSSRPGGQQVAVVWPRHMIPTFFPNFRWGGGRGGFACWTQVVCGGSVWWFSCVCVWGGEG